MRTFKDRLRAGIEVEERVLKLIKVKYPCSTRIEGQFPDYDIWVPELHRSVEVKLDSKSIETNNVCIKCLDLSRTKADWWVIYNVKRYMWSTPELLKQCIKINKIDQKVINGNRVYLIPMDILEGYLILI